MKNLSKTTSSQFSALEEGLFGYTCKTSTLRSGGMMQTCLSYVNRVEKVFCRKDLMLILGPILRL